MAEPVPTIYSYYMPEVRNTVSNALAWLNHGGRGHRTVHDILRQNFDPGLDDLHLPLMEKYESFARSEGVIGLESFDEKYFTNGSSEGIFHLLNGLLPGEQLYQFEGEYHGYEKYAQAIGRSIHTITAEPGRTDLKSHVLNVTPGIVILSNPASKDGNIVDPNLLTTILRRHQVIIDLAYMGMTRKPLNIDLTQPGIIAVVGSLSKPFGLYYYRIGFCYSKYPIDSLYGNRWFKNALSIKIGEAVLDDVSNTAKLAALKDKYFALQKRAVAEVNQHFGFDPAGKCAGGSDVWLLARAAYRDADPQDLKPFKRYATSDYRFCLTPYYMEYQND
jgi:aspartate/methionine/tyrosine aminotransferase